MSLDPGWEGRSFETPAHRGLRATRWPGRRLGCGVEIDHAEVLASGDALRRAGLERLGSADRHDLVTARVACRLPSGGRWTPHVGAGAGMALGRSAHDARLPGDGRSAMGRPGGGRRRPRPLRPRWGWPALGEVEVGPA